MLIENTSFRSQIPAPFSVSQMLDDSCQSLGPLLRCTGRTVSPAPAGSLSLTSVQCPDTPVGDVLSEAWVNIDPTLGQELDPEETLVEIVFISKKEPDPKDPQ